MPRANRHDLLGYIRHITHRCHKKELLLQLARDRRAWMGWLVEAKKRYGLSVLNDTFFGSRLNTGLIQKLLGQSNYSGTTVSRWERAASPAGLPASRRVCRSTRVKHEGTEPMVHYCIAGVNPVSAVCRFTRPKPGTPMTDAGVSHTARIPTHTAVVTACKVVQSLENGKPDYAAPPNPFREWRPHRQEHRDVGIGGRCNYRARQTLTFHSGATRFPELTCHGARAYEYFESDHSSVSQQSRYPLQ